MFRRHVLASTLALCFLAGSSGALAQPAMPDVPTIAESGVPGFEWDAWGSLHAPAKTPRAIVNRWNQEVRRAASAPDIQKRLHAIGMDAVATSPDEVEGMIKQQMAVVAKLAKAAGIRPE